MREATPHARVLHRSAVARVGDFRCPPGDPLWRQPNCIGSGHHVVFPATPVRIAHHGRDPVVVDSNAVVLYDDGAEYRREQVGAYGDRCLWVAFDAGALTGIAPGALDPRGRFRRSTGPATERTCLLARRLHRALRGPYDPLLADEAVALLAGAALGAAGPDGTPQLRDAVERVKEALHADLAAPVTLAELGRAVHYSPYHLARGFRRATGRSIAGYREQLRLRAALDAVADGAPLQDVAHRFGFAHHSHFAQRFRRAFGVAPSQWRRSAAELADQ